jgi:hypothetical protein
VIVSPSQLGNYKIADTYPQPPANTIGFSLSAASGGSATGTATARQTIDGWSIQLTVQGLKDSNTNDHRLTAGR